MEIDTNLLALFHAEVNERDGSYVIELPSEEVEIGDIEPGSVYRFGIFQTGSEGIDSSDQRGRARDAEPRTAPVTEGEVLDVEIEDVGDQGDGLARVGPGYIVFVPDTEVGEEATVEITEVRENLAFAEVLGR